MMKTIACPVYGYPEAESQVQYAVLADPMSSFRLVFYQSTENAVFKALGVE